MKLFFFCLVLMTCRKVHTKIVPVKDSTIYEQYTPAQIDSLKNAY